MNPHSIEGNNLNSSPNNLAFRAPLGGELYTSSVSIHPKIIGSWTTTSSFNLNSNFSYTTTPTFNPNTEYFFIDQPLTGIRNAISDKIRIENNVIPSGDTLSAFRSLSQNVEISQSYTANTNLLEVAFSPQDELNNDIANQIGYYNIGEYIGDPKFRSSRALTYPELDTLRNEYFEKYTKNYNLVDFIRLIKFFDNSLFKLIKDFVPARTSLASGIIIKQHILERNRYPQPQVDTYSTIAYTTSGSNNNIPFTFQDISVTGTLIPQWNSYNPGTVENFSGGTGGTFEMFNGVNTSPYGPNGIGPKNIFNLTQSWYENTPTISGSVLILRNTQDEFYNGEFSGSALTVTTQSLAQAYPVQNESFLYKQVYYYGTGSGEENIFENLFLNNVTSPQNGEILFMNNGAVISIFGTNIWVPIYNTKFLKIAKIDCSGSNNTTALGQLDTILINTPIVGYPTNVWLQYDVTVLNEQSNYYLYQANSVKYLNQPITYISSSYPNQVFNYTVSASNASTFIPSSLTIPTTVTLYGSVSGNTLNYFNSTTGIHTLGNTPNTPISITGSVLIGGTGTGKFNINLVRQGITTTLSSTTVSAGFSYSISSSYYGLQEDQISLNATRGSGSPQFTNGSLLLTQSRAVSSSNCELVIFEPYITEPNYYYSNFNPVMNSINENRSSTIYEEVSYNSSIQTPTNFAQIINRSAIKANVQDSNYSTKRHILPRYEGSKSTSQYLNVWTEGDSGTYGKTPTVENLKTMIAYCDSISGWPPERMNASAIHVLYLIKQDGTVVIPNASQNSLADMQGTFMSGEKLLISSKTIGSGDAIQSRNIIRGGTRIEPILYTQYGQAPNALWNTTMSFTDIIPSNTGVVGNYGALYGKTGGAQTLTYGTPQQVTINQTIYGTPVTLNSYTIPLNAVKDGIQFNVDTNIRVRLLNPNSSGNPYSYLVTLYIYKNSTIISSTPYSAVNVYSNSENYIEFSNTSPVTLTAGNYNTGDTISAYIKVDNYEEYPGGAQVFNQNTTLKITQYPAFTLPVTSSGINSIWNWPNSSSYPYVITSSQTTLVNLYGDPNVKMVDITGSGFNSIALPWSIKYGDEFRFEGSEDFVYQVGKIFGPAESGSGRLFQTGSIEVHLNSNLPVSASSSVFNLDHFAIRRYVDDASLILMEGFKPANANGPYIVRPEYIVPELNKSVDEFILNLTQKGLIT